MEVRNLIKPNAVLVQITEIGKGDVYKRILEPSYSEPKVVYGSVIDVLNNGEEASLIALEFTPEAYGTGVSPTVRVFTGRSEVALFPCGVEEYKHHLEEAMMLQTKILDSAEKDVEAKRSILMKMLDQSRATLSIATITAIGE
jgi:hypothetical protein